MQDKTDADSPLTSSRAVRLALAKAAQDSISLPLTVSSIAEEVDRLDAMLGALPDGLMLVRLEKGDGLAGLIAVDAEMRAAVVEVETTGAVSLRAAEPRLPTGTDRFLCDPVLKMFLSAFPQAVSGTDYAGWADDVSAGTCFANTRLAGLELADGRYRSLQMTVQIGQTDRQGMLIMALPLPEPVTRPSAVSKSKENWSEQLHKVVESVPATLIAELHRFSVSLGYLQGLKVGDVIRLDGCSVSSIKLRDAEGKPVATARLGQSMGKRAVRLEAPPQLDLKELPTNSPVQEKPAEAFLEPDLAIGSIDEALPLSPQQREPPTFDPTVDLD
ncbi:FliM/FliN family flagellar motor switch protein [Yoonia litorea]|uniref:Flagellar motor switch protein FliM n=1 Tax=Yoonia litorea TaxID=1123755 RepID=A0A1I6LNK5_9RHOB|nr:FliM/FliN family flagellar motor switch protein [Yoonia litorea]SFS04832.1 flagellar motor switch protein FliM [Yoonia litorea]